MRLILHPPRCMWVEHPSLPFTLHHRHKHEAHFDWIFISIDRFFFVSVFRDNVFLCDMVSHVQTSHFRLNRCYWDLKEDFQNYI